MNTSFGAWGTSHDGMHPQVALDRLRAMPFDQRIHQPSRVIYGTDMPVGYVPVDGSSPYVRADSGLAGYGQVGFSSTDLTYYFPHRVLARTLGFEQDPLEQDARILDQIQFLPPGAQPQVGTASGPYPHGVSVDRSPPRGVSPYDYTPDHPLQKVPGAPEEKVRTGPKPGVVFGLGLGGVALIGLLVLGLSGRGRRRR